MEIDYEKIYPINTNCIYDNYYLKYVELTENNHNYNKPNNNIIKKISQVKNLISSDSFDVSEIFSYYKEIIHPDKMKYDILTYEFIYGNPKTNFDNINDIKSAYKMLISELDTYQWISGGFNIEDKEWIECNKFTRFTCNENEIIIYNSIEIDNNDEDLEWFLNRIIERVMSVITSNIKVSYEIKEDTKKEISWILISIKKVD